VRGERGRRPVKGRLENLLAATDIVVDCTPKKVAAKNRELYAAKRVIGATMNTSGSFKYRATRGGADNRRLMDEQQVDMAGLEERTRRLRGAGQTVVHQNPFWVVAYNVVAFPAAAGVFSPFVISPEVAALSVSGSSVPVTVDALLLKRTKLCPMPCWSRPPEDAHARRCG
jgi:cation transport ATPase